MRNQVKFSSKSWMLVPGLLLVACGSGFAAAERHLADLGLRYQLIEQSNPRPNRVHVLRVDLGRKAVEPVVVVGADPDGDGPAETALTDPRALAADPSVVAFVNTNPWDSFPGPGGKRNRRWYASQPVDIHGLAVAGGRVRSPAQAHAPVVWVDESGRARVGDGPPGAPVAQAMAGFSRIVEEGAAIASAGGARHPRTAIGVNREGTAMWLVVVDGRQGGFSEGMRLRELAGVMVELGCWHALNMDGGGSSIMGLADEEGRLRVVNSPSDRRDGKIRIRPLPMVLTIRAKGGAGGGVDGE